MAKKKLILSLDGGGIHGVSSLLILQEIEKRVGKKIHEIFDVMIGTSVGGFLTLLINKPAENNNPAYSIDDVMEKFTLFGKKILTPTWKDKILTAKGILGPLYSKKNFKQYSKELLGESTLVQSVKHVLIPTYNVDNDSIVAFDSHDNTVNNHKLRNIALAATAIPTLFAPEKMIIGDNWCPLSDAGQLLNEPSLWALIHLNKTYPDEEKIIISIGCGRVLLDNDLQLKRNKDGLTDIVNNNIRIFSVGLSNYLSQTMKMIIEQKQFNLKNYTRLNAIYPKTVGNVIDVSDKSYNLLVEHTKLYIEYSNAAFEEVAQLIKDNL